MSSDVTTKRRSIYGSSSAFMQGTLVMTEVPSGCLRTIYLNACGVRDNSIDPCHIVRGAFNEEEYEKRLQAAGIPYERELSLRSPIAGFEDMQFSGRFDFRITSPEGNPYVIELKSTESKNRLKSIKGGFYKTYNLAQLVAYMIETSTTAGSLIYTYFEKENDLYVQKYEKELKVVIDDKGNIVVNSIPSGFSVHDQLLHRHTAAKVIDQDIIWARPHKWAEKWSSPCGLCAFKNTCTKYDTGKIEGAVAFVEDAKKSLIKETSNDDSASTKV